MEKKMELLTGERQMDSTKNKKFDCGCTILIHDDGKVYGLTLCYQHIFEFPTIEVLALNVEQFRSAYLAPPPLGISVGDTVETKERIG